MGRVSHGGFASSGGLGTTVPILPFAMGFGANATGSWVLSLLFLLLFMVLVGTWDLDLVLLLVVGALLQL